MITLKTPNLNTIPQFTRSPRYSVDVSWKYIEEQLEHYNERDGGLDLNPDFQRGHVWTPEKQIAYVEFCLRGGNSARDIYFNHPGWNSSYEGTMELVDGKQRLTAVLGFLHDEIPAFGYKYSEFEGTLRLHQGFKFNINDLQTRAEVLQWYLDMNTGGVVHTDKEINKVKRLLQKVAKGDGACTRFRPNHA